MISGGSKWFAGVDGISVDYVTVGEVEFRVVLGRYERVEKLVRFRILNALPWFGVVVCGALYVCTVLEW